MSKSTNMKQKRKTSRAQVRELPHQEKELEDQEAKQVKGGGGARAGVDMPLRSNPLSNEKL